MQRSAACNAARHATGQGSTTAEASKLDDALTLYQRVPLPSVGHGRAWDANTHKSMCAYAAHSIDAWHMPQYGGRTAHSAVRSMSCAAPRHAEQQPARRHTYASRHTRTQAHTHAGTHARRHTRTQAHTHARTHAHTHTTHAHTHAHTHSRTVHTHAHPHAHTHTHTPTRARARARRGLSDFRPEPALRCRRAVPPHRRYATVALPSPRQCCGAGQDGLAGPVGARAAASARRRVGRGGAADRASALQHRPRLPAAGGADPAERRCPESNYRYPAKPGQRTVPAPFSRAPRVTLLATDCTALPLLRAGASCCTE